MTHLDVHVAVLIDALGKVLATAAFTADAPGHNLVDLSTVAAVPEQRSVNAVAESFFGSLKKERIKKRIYKNRDAANVDSADYIKNLYSRMRCHSYFGGVSPGEFGAAVKRPRGRVQ